MGVLAKPNGFTAFLVLGVVTIVKFTPVVWIAILAVLLFVLLFRKNREDRSAVTRGLSLSDSERPRAARNTVIMPVPATPDRVVLAAVEYAKSISKDVIAVHVNTEGRDRSEILARWKKFVDDVPLIVFNSPHRSVLRPLLRFIDEIAALRSEDKLTVVVPELVPKRWWHKPLHNHISSILKEALLLRPGIVVTSVPYQLKGRPRTKTEF